MCCTAPNVVLDADRTRLSPEASFAIPRPAVLSGDVKTSSLRWHAFDPDKGRVVSQPLQPLRRCCTRLPHSCTGGAPGRGAKHENMVLKRPPLCALTPPSLLCLCPKPLPCLTRPPGLGVALLREPAGEIESACRLLPSCTAPKLSTRCSTPLQPLWAPLQPGCSHCARGSVAVMQAADAESSGRWSSS